MTQQSINERFTFREIYMYEIPQAIGIEQVCFPPNEACSAQAMKERIACAPELFLVAIENESGLLAGFLNGLATDETTFRDEFFTDANLHNYDGKNIMLLGLDVLPQYRMQGLARELVNQYCAREQARGREALILTSGMVSAEVAMQALSNMLLTLSVPTASAVSDILRM